VGDNAGMTDPVVAEAAKKAAVAWFSVAGGPAYPLWCLPVDGILYVVVGPGEQDAPGLADAEQATVTLRGDHGGRIATGPATVARLAPGTPEWDTVVPQLAGKRLNASGTAEQLAARWQADGCAVLALNPTGPAVTAGDLPDDGEAAPPRPTPARVDVRRPLRLHRVRGSQ
jgi:hypothetical protein